MAYQQYPPPNSGQWTTGICGCFEDWLSCCMGCWLPCVPIGQYIEVLDEGRTSCLAAGTVWCCLQSWTGCGCLYTCGYRARLRHKFGLPEEPCLDFCTECCCYGCSICQVTRELKNRNIDPNLGYEAVRHVFEQPPQGPPPAQQYMFK